MILTILLLATMTARPPISNVTHKQYIDNHICNIFIPIPNKALKILTKRNCIFSYPMDKHLSINITSWYKIIMAMSQEEHLRNFWCASNLTSMESKPILVWQRMWWWGDCKHSGWYCPISLFNCTNCKEHLQEGDKEDRNCMDNSHNLLTSSIAVWDLGDRWIKQPLQEK